MKQARSMSGSSVDLRWYEVVAGEFCRLFMALLAAFVVTMIVAGSGLMKGLWPLLIPGVGVGIAFPVWWTIIAWRAITGRPLRLGSWHEVEQKKVDLWKGRKRSTFRAPAGTQWGKV